MRFATYLIGVCPGKEQVKGVEFKVGRKVVCRASRIASALKMVVACVLLLGGSVELLHAGEQAATVRNVRFTGDDRDPGIEITASKAVTPRTETVTGPDRLIVDLPETRPEPGLRKILINRGTLRDVRVALLSANPPTTRIVLDLVAPIEYGVSPLANRIIVKLGGKPGTASGAGANPATNALPTAITAALPGVPIGQPSERSWAHWIMPILVMTTILAMLVIALGVHLQNKRQRRGL